MVRIWIDDDGIVRLEARGALDPVAAAAVHEDFYRQHWDAFVAADRHLADYRGAQLDNIPGDAIREAAERNVEISRLRPPLRIAVLIDAGLGFGLARMWEQHAQETGWPLQIFTDEAAAWEWLRSDVP
jgi:hypothetical protein